MQHFAIVLPAYNPTELLLELIDDLHQHPDFGNHVKIVVINDGSNPETQPIFEAIPKTHGIKLLVHNENKGKGAALKTSFSYLLDTHIIGVVTADADGQHTPHDIYRVAASLNENPSSLIMGERDFNLDDIPPKSRFGNKITSSVFKASSGVALHDTQTGLRGIPYNFMKDLLHVKGDRYEFEMNMLMEAAKNNISFVSVPIETIYYGNNEQSHFKPVRDSIKVYSAFFKFLFSSASSFLIDIGIFALVRYFLLAHTTHAIMIATLVSRAISSLYNFVINEKVVFAGDHKKHAMGRYYILVVVQSLTSGALVSAFYALLGHKVLVIKILVDLVLFLISYQIQRRWVFQGKHND
ncbi:glycosyltransferase [Erysipelothrix sp. HDW6C]|uniref:bifunctional glycosyltransferase family 2/GtrA family protein n=1 Tax=Erysipelothrix sp. HDW6C TaxID=2714930 RepID=UPI001409C786|nr:bifunctional glycosyltransferase family 2/GtrA family protein [Erysipelothrix sp. HDW6C]QIK69199.1 glycosyltransferase [Erysipelothrix sp. HDW6C]